MSDSDARKFATAFGAELAKQLEGRGTSQRALASATGRHPSYITQTMNGTKSVSPQWADLVADVLKLPEKERVKLHRAAASDHGFKLDLTKKK